MSRKVNLNAYFERIGFVGSIAPNLATLELIHALHPATIPFENLDPLLGLPVLLDEQSLEHKMLTGRRGGYCFEHNTLLKAMLGELDFSVRGLAARVVLNDPEAINQPPTHMVLAIDIAGTTYIADCGFGGLGLTAPLKLRADVAQATPHGTYRLTGGAPDWHLQAQLGEDWRTLYVFTLDEWEATDYLAPNLYASSDPASKFTRDLAMALSPSGCRITLAGNVLTTRVMGEPDKIDVLDNVEQMRTTLGEVFGLAVLPDAERLDPVLQRIIEQAPAVP